MRDSPPASTRTCVGSECSASATTCRSRWSTVTGAAVVTSTHWPVGSPNGVVHAVAGSPSVAWEPRAATLPARWPGARDGDAARAGVRDPEQVVEPCVGRVGREPRGAADPEGARVGDPELADERVLDPRRVGRHQVRAQARHREDERAGRRLLRRGGHQVGGHPGDLAGDHVAGRSRRRAGAPRRGRRRSRTGASRRRPRWCRGSRSRACGRRGAGRRRSAPPRYATRGRGRRSPRGRRRT